jgi:hypothetical protein
MFVSVFVNELYAFVKRDNTATPNWKGSEVSTIKIGNIEKPLDHAHDHWVEREIHHQRHQNRTVCVLVRLICHPVDIMLATPGCACGGGGGRQPNATERKIFREWNERGLNRLDWTIHNLIHFLKHVRNFC